MIKLFFGWHLITFPKNFIVDGRLGCKEAPENNEIFKTKPRWIIVIVTMRSVSYFMLVLSKKDKVEIWTFSRISFLSFFFKNSGGVL